MTWCFGIVKPPLFTSVGHNYRLRFAGEQHLDCRHNSNRGFRIARSLIQEKEPELEIVKVEEEATDIMKSHRRKSSQMMIGGVKVSPELFAIAMVYFVQGTVSLSSLATSYYLKDTLMQTPGQVALLQSYGKLPWLAKPLYGFASDSIPIFGYRQKSYLALCGLMSALSWWVLSSTDNGPLATTICMFVASLGIAFCDVVIDSVVVMRSRGASQSTTGGLQSLCWASAAVGGVACSFCSGYLLENIGPRGIFSIVAVFPLIVSCSSFFVKEDPYTKASPDDEVQGGNLVRPVRLSSRFLFQTKALWNAFNDKQILLPAAFLFIWMATPNSSSAMFFFYTEKLHFTPEFMGRITFVGELASLCGVGLYNFYLKDIPLRNLFRWTCIIGTLLGLTQLLLVTGANRSLGLSDELFVIGDSIILDVVGKVSFMPILVLAATLCPDGVEASLFALLMSILNAGSFTGQALGGGLTQALGITSTEFANLPLLVTICVVSTLLPLPFLRLLPTDKSIE